MAKVLITGASGFAGTAICRYLLTRGWKIRGTVRAAAAMVPEGVEKVVTGAIDAATDWRSALDGVEAVVHCAARVHVLRETSQDPLADFRRVNVAASRRLAEQALAAGVRRFVFVSSIGAAVAEGDRQAAQPYQLSKLEAEEALQAVVGESNMVLVMLRPPLIYGAEAPGNFARLAGLIARGCPLPLASLGSPRSQLYVGNLASAVEAALEAAASPPAALALSDGKDLSAAQLARAIGLAAGRPARLLPCPPCLLRLAGRLLGREAAVEALTGSLTVDNAAIHKALSWTPAYSVEQGLKATFHKTQQSPDA